MKTKGVIFYNRGTKCMVRLIVSLFSLRKHWKGPVSVICSGDQEDWFVEAIKKLDAEVVPMPMRKGEGSLVLKASLWRYSPYDLTMYMDADTVVLKPIDEYFDYIEEHDFVTGGFANWKTTGSTMSKRIKSWSKCCPEHIKPSIDFGKAVNTGIDGWKKDATLLKEWEDLTIKGYKMGCTKRIVDEVACQLLLYKHKCLVADTRWGESVKFGKYDDSTIIIHYHGNKHAGDRPQNNVWKYLYHEACNFLQLDGMRESHGDRSLRSYLRAIPKNLTIVSAVNKAYLNKFKSNWPLWQKTENIMEMPFMIFAHTDCYNEVKNYLKDWKQVKVIEWSFPVAKGNMREEMLSAFVFGTAKHVRTKYWMKLDGDCTPTANKLEIPEEAFKSVITATKWHYTKCKGDPDYIEGESVKGKGRNWLNKLDDWADGLSDFNGTKRLFPDDIKPRRYGHRRICSFCEVEKTAWTKHLAQMCGDRLPIPSQDTVTWYAAKRIGRKITEFKFRNYLKP